MMPSPFRRRRLIGLCLTLLALSAAVVTRSPACPFCSAPQTTLSEEIQQSAAAVIATLVSQEEDPSPGATANAKFDVQSVLKGADVLGDTKQIETLYFGSQPVGSSFLVVAVGPKPLLWSTPTPLSKAAAEYVSHLATLPEKGVERLLFVQEYLEDADPMLAQDAYDEFARAPYDEVQAIKDQMHRDRLLKWIEDPNTTTQRRRLFLTMLGVCGQAEDVAALEKLMRNDDNATRPALDAIVASYLNLKGSDGLPLVEELFLKNPDAAYVDTYSAIMALRFHGQETKVIAKPRLAEALRHVLSRPQLADLVIADLARWQDWSAMDQLVELFKNAKEGDGGAAVWVRVPVINYLRACPLPEAKERIAELEQIDPEAVRQAKKFFAVGPLVPKNKELGQRPDDKQKPADDKAKVEAETPKPALPADETSIQRPVPLVGGSQIVAVAATTELTASSSNAERVVAASPIAAEIDVEPTSSPASASVRPATKSTSVAALPPKVAPLARAVGGSPLAVFAWSAVAGGVLSMLMLLVLRGGQSPL